MARNGTGTYLKPLPNVNPGETITSTWANTTITDIGNEITNSLPRDGQVGMLAPLKGIDGSSGSPSFSFSSNSSTGLYLVSAGVLAAVANGVEIWRGTSSAFTVTPATTLSSTLGVTGATTLSSTLAVTGASTLTGNVGIGVTPSYKLHVDAGAAVQGIVLQGTSGSGVRADFIVSSTARGYIGAGATVFTGGAVTDFGIASQGALLFGGPGGAVLGRFNSSGNFSFGSTAPTNDKVLVTKSSSLGSPEGSSGIYVNTGLGAGNVGLLMGADSANNTAFIQSVEPTVSYSSKTLALNPNGGKVYTAGFFGIGVTSPTTALEMDVSSAEVARWNGTASNGSFLRWRQGSVDHGYIGTGPVLGYTTNEFIFNAGASKHATIASNNSTYALKLLSTGEFVVNAGNTATASMVIGGQGSAGHTAGFRNSLQLRNSASSGGQSNAVILGSAGTPSTWTILNDINADGSTINQLDILNGANQRWRINSTGAINQTGTTALYSLDRSSGTNDTYLTTTFGGTPQGYIGWAGTTNGLINGAATGDMTLRSQNGNILFSTNSGSTAAMKITSAGFVDITNGSGALTMSGGKTRFESSEISVPSSTLTTVSAAHGGPRKPDLFTAVLRCKSAEYGYGVGAEIDLKSDQDGSTDQAIAHVCDATNVYFIYKRTAAVPIAVRRADTGVLANVTAANWRVVFYAHWL